MEMYASYGKYHVQMFFHKRITTRTTLTYGLHNNYSFLQAAHEWNDTQSLYVSNYYYGSLRDLTSVL